MDKTQGIGAILLMMVLVTYYIITAPTEAEIAKQQFLQDSINNAKLQQNEVLATTAPINQVFASTDSIAVAKLNTQYGPFGSAMTGEEQIVTLENDDLEIHFSSIGGKITKAVLKKHKKILEDEAHVQSEMPLELLEDKKNRFEYLIPTSSYGNISTAKLNFKPQLQGKTLTMTAALDNGGQIVQKYTLAEEGYNVDHVLKLDGLESLIDPSNKKLRFTWHNYLDRLELNTTFEQYYSTIYYKEKDEGSDYCNCRSDDIEEIDDNQIEWVSNVNQFFNTSIIPKNKKYENARFETVVVEKDALDLKLLKTELDIPLDLVASESIESSLYIGPNEFESLRTYGNELEQIIPFGKSIFGSINRWVIRPAFNWLSKYIGSKGIVIIVLIFIIKMILYPLMYKMLHSQAKMGLLKPDLAHLKEKYKDDSQKIQMETMKIYKEYGVSPLGGCMPMILQMPIWYDLFRFFPASITFRQEPFLWAADLSSYDVIARLPFEIPAFGAHISLFTILWAVSTIIYSFYNMRHMDMSANPAMKYIQYFMPITFLFFFNTYASGLTCYMFFSNLFNIGQTVLTKKFVFNDDRLRAELDAHKSKPKKKGGFQAKLEEAMAQQQKLAKQKNNQSKKKKKR